MNEWKTVKLGDIADVLSGYAFKSNDFVDKGIPVVKIKNIIPPCVVLDDVQYVSDELAEQKKRYQLRYNDILISLTGSNINQFASAVGKVGRVKSSKKMMLNQRVGKFEILDTKKYSQDFLYYLISTDEMHYKLAINASGAANQANISPAMIKDIVLPCPKIEEQKAIAETLSCLDDKIELNNRINKTLEEMAQAIFKSWFVDFEPFKDGEFEDSELGKIPKGWKVEKLISLCDVITKGTTPTTLKKQFVESGINFIKAESITDTHSFDVQKFAYIDEETNKLLKRSQLRENDILLTIAGTIGRYALTPNNILPANTNQAVAIIRLKNDILNPVYLINSFLCNLHKEFLGTKVVQAVQANLSLGVIGELPVILPSNNVLEEYYKIILPIFEKNQKYTDENSVLTSIRDSLLPRLMSGEIRIPIEEVV